MTDTAPANQLTHRDEELVERLTAVEERITKVVMDLCATVGENRHDGGESVICEEDVWNYLRWLGAAHWRIGDCLHLMKPRV